MIYMMVFDDILVFKRSLFDAATEVMKRQNIIKWFDY